MIGIENMIANKETNKAKDAECNLDQDCTFDNRHKHDRRIEPSKGYTYISVVGWIDRREKLRRKDDPYNF
jgi:hypothetical protein